MKLKDTTIILTLAFSVLILANACNKDDDEFVPTCDGSTPTYDVDIATIINNNCTDASCHNAGAVIGDWTTYESMDMSNVFDNGEFETRVLDDMSMPQGSATLSEAQLNLIRCWVDNGFPEN